MNHSERLTAQEALAHPYFEGLEQEDTLRRMSTSTKNESRHIVQDELIQTTGINERKRNFPPGSMHPIDREKTDHSSMGDHIFVVNKAPQKLAIGKKRKEDNFMTSKGMSNYNSSNGTKSLGKSKLSTKNSHTSNNSTNHSNQRHASIEKGKDNR